MLPFAGRATGLHPRKETWYSLFFSEWGRKLPRVVQESKKESFMSAERWKEDEALLESLRKRGPGAVRRVVPSVPGKIFNLAMSILKNESDAEEAAQDVFMTVIRQVDTFQGNSAFTRGCTGSA